jgi:hypothetical protein
MGEDGRAIALDMLVEPEFLASTTEQRYVTAGGKPYVASAVQAMLAR